MYYQIRVGKNNVLYQDYVVTYILCNNGRCLHVLKCHYHFIAWMQFIAAAMMDIRRNYKVQKNWMGDPCVPQAYQGVNCSYQDGNPHRIISM